jgi:hypothetical protein
MEQYSLANYPVLSPALLVFGSNINSALPSARWIYINISLYPILYSIFCILYRIFCFNLYCLVSTCTRTEERNRCTQNNRITMEGHFGFLSLDSLHCWRICLIILGWFKFKNHSCALLSHTCEAYKVLLTSSCS